MFSLTKQERLVLLILATVLFAGSTLSFLFKKYPELEDIVNLIDSDKIYTKIDVNTASLEELVSVPYIGPYSASQILDYRREHGKFTSLAELKAVRGIKEKNYQKFFKFLKVSQ